MKLTQRAKDIAKITGLPVLIASLCCLSPLVLFWLGVGTAAWASSLADTFYYGYKWWFRLAGLIALAISLAIYFRSKGVCTLDEAKQRKNEIINIVLLTLIVFAVGYVLWLYGAVHILGAWAGIWEMVPDKSVNQIIHESISL